MGQVENECVVVVQIVGVVVIYGFFNIFVDFFGFDKIERCVFGQVDVVCRDFLVVDVDVVFGGRYLQGVVEDCEGFFGDESFEVLVDVVGDYDGCFVVCGNRGNVIVESGFVCDGVGGYVDDIFGEFFVGFVIEQEGDGVFGVFDDGLVVYIVVDIIVMQCVVIIFVEWCVICMVVNFKGIVFDVVCIVIDDSIEVVMLCGVFLSVVVVYDNVLLCVVVIWNLYVGQLGVVWYKGGCNVFGVDVVFVEWVVREVREW